MDSIGDISVFFFSDDINVICKIIHNAVSLNNVMKSFESTTEKQDGTFWQTFLNGKGKGDIKWMNLPVATNEFELHLLGRSQRL